MDLAVELKIGYEATHNNPQDEYLKALSGFLTQAQAVHDKMYYR